MTHKEQHEQDLVKANQTPWWGVDLDATLAVWTKWGDPIGAPIPKMLARVYQWRAEGKVVKLFTARWSERETQEPLIRAWLKPLGLEDMEITNVKDLQMIELWDDRAVQLIPNTGERVDGKR